MSSSWVSLGPLKWSPITSFSPNWKDMDLMVDCLMDKELVVRSCLERGGQWFNVQMNISDKWCPSGICTGSMLFNIFIDDIDSGIENRIAYTVKSWKKGIFWGYMRCCSQDLFSDLLKENKELIISSMWILMSISGWYFQNNTVIDTTDAGVYFWMHFKFLTNVELKAKLSIT